MKSWKTRRIGPEMVELTRREREVAGLVAEGLSNRAIATRLFLSERTAEYHVEQIRNKLGFRSRSEVAAWVREQEQVGRSRIRAGNLPLQLSTFIGRGPELAELRPLLDQSRLVTLTGSGGVGKTRLAIKLASGMPWPDGAWFVDLASIGDPDLVWATLARGVEVNEWSWSTLADVVSSHLATKTSLVLLDNCEHVIRAIAPMTAELLGRCEKLRILATSREPLGVSGELTWPVPSLPVPAEAASEPLELLERNDAVRLFVERARLARPSFRLNPANAAAVAEITRRLDGIPLAIELAAARVRTMGPVEIQERLRDRFRLLTGGNRASLPRQQTLRSALDWSYALLSAEERTVLNRLAVFAGGFSLQAAEQVCADEALPGDRVWDLLSRLVEKSIVQREEMSDGSRYRLLETTRVFALEHALQEPDLRQVRARHAAFFLQLAEEAEQYLQGPNQTEWLDRLGEEEDNLRVAHEWFRDEAADLCLRLSVATRWFWVKRGRDVQFRELAVQALSGDHRPTAARGRLLTALAHPEVFAGDYQLARTHMDESVQILRASVDLAGLAEALAWSGAVETVGYCDPARGLEFAKEADQVARRAAEDNTLGAVLNAVGLAWMALGNAGKARKPLEEAVACLRRSGDGWELGKVLESLAEAVFQDQDQAMAANLCAESLKISMALGPRGNVAYCLELFARLAADSDPLRAVRLAAGAATVRRGAGWVLARREQASIEGWLRAVQTPIATEAAEAAWREGAGMPLDELVDYAVKEPLLGARSGGDAGP